MVVFEWHARFMASSTAVEDDDYAGKLINSTCTTLLPKLSILFAKIDDEPSMGHVNEMDMHCFSAKLLPRNLSIEYKEHVLQFAGRFIRSYPTFLSRVITNDENWIYGYDPETKQQSQCKSSSLQSKKV